MDPVNPLSSLAELMRKRIAAEASGKRSGLSSSRGNESEKAAPEHKVDVDELRVQIVRSLQSIDPDESMRPGKTMRVFVESVLTWQFGAGVLSDPRFAILVSDVQATMESDPVVQEVLNRFLTECKRLPKAVVPG